MGWIKDKPIASDLGDRITQLATEASEADRVAVLEKRLASALEQLKMSEEMIQALRETLLDTKPLGSKENPVGLNQSFYIADIMGAPREMVLTNLRVDTSNRRDPAFEISGDVVDRRTFDRDRRI